MTGLYDTVSIYFLAKEDAYGLQVKGSVRQRKEDRDEEDRGKEEKIVRFPMRLPFFVFARTGSLATTGILNKAAGKRPMP